MTAITPGGQKFARCYSHPPCKKKATLEINVNLKICRTSAKNLVYGLSGNII